MITLALQWNYGQLISVISSEHMLEAVGFNVSIWIQVIARNREKALLLFESELCFPEKGSSAHSGCFVSKGRCAWHIDSEIF